MDLNTVWFGVLGFLLTGYAVLDGFDLGIGSLHIVAETDEERRTMLHCVAPVWDGNEVWMVAAGGSLFAAFPRAYSALLSGFYTVVFFILFAFIFRAVSLEFRSKQSSHSWRNLWDMLFSFSSFLIGFLIGVLIGNIIPGLPLDPNGNFSEGLMSLFHPYSMMTGITLPLLFMMHGGTVVCVKTDGELQAKAYRWAKNSTLSFMACALIAFTYTALLGPQIIHPYIKNPMLFVIPVAAVFCLINVLRQLNKEKPFRAFICSAFFIALGALTLGVGIYPNLIISNPLPERSLTIYNAASSGKTLSIMLFIVAACMPIVIGYTILVYRIFRGKVRLSAESY